MVRVAPWRKAGLLPAKQFCGKTVAGEAWGAPVRAAIAIICQRFAEIAGLVRKVLKPLCHGPADHPCRNYTSGATEGSVQVGHFDRSGGGNTSWNSAHASRGCSAEKLQSSGGAGLFYCFAAD